MPRIFVAIPVAPTVRSALGQLRAHKAPALRWVAEHQYHITLKFLGDVDENDVAAVHEAVEQAVATAMPARPARIVDEAAADPSADGLLLVARGVGAFPNPRRARVIWAGVSGDVGPLRRVQAAVNEQLGLRGFEADDRPFSPHITVARARQPLPLPKVLEAYAEHDFGRWRAEHIEVVESVLTPSGPHYTVRSRIPLVP